MNWFRFYTESLDNPKIQRLPGDLFKAWVNLLCLARLHDGRLPSADDIAFRLRVSPEQARSYLKELQARKLLDLDSEGLKPHDWQQYQYPSDVSTERVDRYRQKTRDNGAVVGAYQKHRKAIFARDSGACAYCASVENLCLDHMIPIQMGGDDHPDNLCCSCKACNSGKAGRTPDLAGFRFVSSEAESAYRRTLSRLQTKKEPGNLSRDLSPPATVTATDLSRSRIDKNREEKKQNRTDTKTSAAEKLSAQVEESLMQQQQVVPIPLLPPKEILPPPLPATSDYPETLKACRSHDAGVGPVFASRIVQESIQAALSDAQACRHAHKITDSKIAAAVHESYATGPPVHRSGLLLNRVPAIIVSWCQEDN